MQFFRITDFTIPYFILKNEQIASVICEDGGRIDIPNVVDEFWVGAAIEEGIIGCYQFNYVSAVVWEMHIRILPQFRHQYALDASKGALAWAFDNIAGINKIIGYVPEVYEKAAAHCENIGMKQEAYLAESFLLNGEIIGQKYYSITEKEFRGMLCQ